MSPALLLRPHTFPHCPLRCPPCVAALLAQLGWWCADSAVHQEIVDVTGKINTQLTAGHVCVPTGAIVLPFYCQEHNIEVQIITTDEFVHIKQHIS